MVHSRDPVRVRAPQSSRVYTDDIVHILYTYCTHL